MYDNTASSSIGFDCSLSGQSSGTMWAYGYNDTKCTVRFKGSTLSGYSGSIVGCTRNYASRNLEPVPTHAKTMSIGTAEPFLPDSETGLRNCLKAAFLRMRNCMKNIFSQLRNCRNKLCGRHSRQGHISGCCRRKRCITTSYRIRPGQSGSRRDACSFRRGPGVS